MTSPLVQLARETIDTYVREGRIIKPPEHLTKEMEPRAGVFVSIHKGEDLRGCIGTIEPVRANVAQEIIANAVSAATQDPRFEPIRPDELKDLDINVDVLTTPEPVSDISTLDPRKYGVIVECGYRRGLLLPDLPGVDTVQEQINICCAKGGIHANEKVNLYKFEVKRYK